MSNVNINKFDFTVCATRLAVVRFIEIAGIYLSFSLSRNANSDRYRLRGIICALKGRSNRARRLYRSDICANELFGKINDSISCKMTYAKKS